MAKGFTRNELVSAISKDADVRVDVVKDVLDSFINVAIEEIANKGTFNIKNFVKISSYPWAGYTAGRGYEVPKHYRLSVKLAASVRNLFKLKNEDPELEITRSNWRDVLRKVEEETVRTGVSPNPAVNGKVTEAGKKADQAPAESEDDDDFNPILDDDE